MTPDERAHAILIYAQPDGRNIRDYVLRHITAAITEERERCAAVAEQEACDQTEYRCDTVERIAAAIREGK